MIATNQQIQFKTSPEISKIMDDNMNFELLSEMPPSYDNLILLDITNVVARKYTLDEYYDFVLARHQKKYNKINKFLYGEMIQAIKIISSTKKRYPKRKLRYKNAIVFLHQEMKLAPTTIKLILDLFECKLSICRIMQISSEIFLKKIGTNSIFSGILKWK